MRNRKIGKFTTAGFVILIALVVALLLTNSLRRSSRIVLPDMTQIQPEEILDLAQDNAALTPITVTPETVQAAVSSLRRPLSYRRSVTVERLWDGGSGMTKINVSVHNGWTRLDSTPDGGQTRHVLTDGETTYVWYGSERTFYEGAAGSFTADAEQGIPTYEDVLALAPTQIETADYRSVSGVNCIYVETGEDDRGYVLRYWISVDTGLLAAAEWLEDGRTIYRMGSPTLDATGLSSEDFTLPDGTMLTEVS